MIYVNGRFLLQVPTGVNRFAYELCRTMARLGEPFVLCVPHGRIHPGYDLRGLCYETWGVGRSHGWEQVSLPLWFSRQKGPKVLVSLTGLGPVWGSRKVMTIHDLAFLVAPQWYARSYVCLYKWLTPLCAATSRRVLTVSRSSQGEIVRRLRLRPEKVEVVYNAVADVFMEKAGEAVGAGAEKPAPCPGKYVLAVSSIDPRKNFHTLIEAFAHVSDPSVRLYVVGGQNRIYAATVGDLLRHDVAGRVEWLGRVSDVRLRQLYAHALCLVYPSLYEGFGLPPLEAMACGAPVVVSDIPPLREVCGDAALYVDPHNAVDIAEKINLLAADPSLRAAFAGRGAKRWPHFSWTDSARKLLCVLHACER